MKAQDYLTRKVRKGYNSINQYIDLKKGSIFGGLAGIAVGAINASEGFNYALSSGSKEAAKCLAIGSMNMGICRRLATKIKDKKRALWYATIVPAILSTGLTFCVHAYLRGTPHPVKSTAPTLLSAPFFYILGKRERRIAEQNNQNNSRTQIKPDLEIQLTENGN